MPTSTRCAVAVHILTGLAVSDGKPMRSEDLAYSANTGAVVIRGLLSRLSDAGLTRQLWAGGGAIHVQTRQSAFSNHAVSLEVAGSNPAGRS
ncbi:transcriptional regulator protein (plasmid) [Rhizobium etli 8C-3]|uniref:Transcriptional regulator protein n=1 Tax=Rhizobium etli 8C-3 TaxID=538025 RepID=A0A1L5PCT2_RHIET|nr:transcriptional regulator protein [Rhizobium etli 8C-3]